MVVEVGADAGQVEHRLDADGAQALGIADAGALQNQRRAVHPGGEHERPGDELADGADIGLWQRRDLKNDLNDDCSTPHQRLPFFFMVMMASLRRALASGQLPLDMSFMTSLARG